MSKGFRVLLQIFQVIGLLGTLLFLASSLMWYIADFDLTGLAEDSAPIELWAIGFGVLTLALSPALWSLSRVGAAAAAAVSTGSYDRVAPAGPQQQPQQPQQQQQQQQQPGKPANVFEPMNTSQAPAPPASSYGQQQPQAGGYGGGITPASPAPTDGPWGGGR
jgi:hypothetical protein